MPEKASCSGAIITFFLFLMLPEGEVLTGLSKFA